VRRFDFLGEHRLNVPALESREIQIAMVFAEAFEDTAPHALAARVQIAKGD
jgi:hypothetical protein